MNTETTGHLSPTLEGYLEVLIDDQSRTGVARLGEIARRVSVKPSTASTALATLTHQGFIEQVGRGIFRVTNSGLSYNNKLRKRHEILSSFLHQELCLTSGDADEQACRMEHLLPDAVIVALERYMERLSYEPFFSSPFISVLNTVTGCSDDIKSSVTEWFELSRALLASSTAFQSSIELSRAYLRESL